MPWGKYRKVQNFSILIEKKVTKIDKNGNENLVTISYKIIVQKLWQRHYQILLINSQKELTKLKVNIDRFLECENVKDNFIKYKR